MDASRDIIESSRPPKPPRRSQWFGPSNLSDPSDPSEANDRASRTSPLVQLVALCAVATVVFTGITAWETHQERVNTEVIYCTLISSDGGDPEAPSRSDAEQRMFDQLGCE